MDSRMLEEYLYLKEENASLNQLQNDGNKKGNAGGTPPITKQSQNEPEIGKLPVLEAKMKTLATCSSSKDKHELHGKSDLGEKENKAIQEADTNQKSLKKKSGAQPVGKIRDKEVGWKLTFYPELYGCVILDIEDEWNEGVNKWKNSLVGFVHGAKPPIKTMRKYVKRKWGGSSKIQVSIMMGVFIFKFTNSDEMHEVLAKGPWMIGTKPMILTKWTPELDMEQLAENNISA